MTRKEYFSFISITEVSFWKGAFTQYNDKLGITSGLKNIDYVIVCEDMNDVIRESNNQLVLNECKKYNPKPCEMIDVERIN